MYVVQNRVSIPDIEHSSNAKTQTTRGMQELIYILLYCTITYQQDHHHYI